MSQQNFGSSGTLITGPTGSLGPAQTLDQVLIKGVPNNSATMVDRPSLQLAALMLLGGEIVSAVAGFLHPAHEQPNDHAAVFAEYAQNSTWIAVHLGQFVGMVSIVAGLLILFFALNISTGPAKWMVRIGAAVAVVSLALYGVLQAVDGVALKHAVDAWAASPAPEKVARFASAETVRWMEWAARGYHSFVLGLALVLYALAIILTERASRGVGVVMGLSGLAYFAHGWIVSDEGFSATNTIPTLLTIVLFLTWSIWLLVVAMGRSREKDGSGHRS